MKGGEPFHAVSLGFTTKWGGHQQSGTMKFLGIICHRYKSLFFNGK